MTARKKKCSRCKNPKPISEFGKRPKNRDGLMGWCRDCYRAYHNEWNRKNPERAKARRLRHEKTVERKAYLARYKEEHREESKRYQREYHKRNREKRLKQSKARYESKKEEILNQMKGYRQAHKKERNEALKDWQRRNPDKVRAQKKRYRDRNLERVRELDKEYSRRRRIAKNDNDGTHSSDQWLELVELCNHKCLACGESKPLAEDHIVPVSKGGSDFISNIQPLCLSCNSKKHIQTTDYRPQPIKEWAESNCERG